MWAHLPYTVVSPRTCRWHHMQLLLIKLKPTLGAEPFSIGIFIFFRKIPRRGTAGLHGISKLNYLRNRHTISIVAAPDCTHKQCMGVNYIPICSSYCPSLVQYLAVFFFLILIVLERILTSVCADVPNIYVESNSTWLFCSLILPHHIYNSPGLRGTVMAIRIGGTTG